MRFQPFVVVGSTLFGLATLVSGVTALRFPDLEEYCGVTTIYVTVAPTSSTASTYQLPNTPAAANYGVISSLVDATSVESGVSISNSGSSIGVDSASTILLTTTVHQTVFLTNTVTGSWYTRTETVEVTSPTSSSTVLDYSIPTSAGEESTPSGGILISSSSSATAAQSAATAFETSALSAPSNTSAQSVAFTQLTSSTSAPPEVYVIETLTVIPLESIPSTLNSIATSTGSTAQSTNTYAIPVVIMDSTASTPVTASVISTMVWPTSTLTSPSQGYTGKASGGWNMSIASSSITSGIASVGTASSTTLGVDALSTDLSSTSMVSSEFINFSNSYLFYNVTSTMAAAAGFTAYSASSPSPFSSASSELSSSSGSQSLILTSPSLSNATELPWTESRSEIISPTSAVDALQSTGIPFNTSTIVTKSLSASFSAAITTSQATWTQSCSEDISATSTANAEQYTTISMTGGLSINPSLTVSSPSRTPWNSTTTSSSASSSGYINSSGIISLTTNTNQSASSGFATTAISSFSSASSPLLITANMTMATTSSSTTSLLSTSVSSTISIGTSEASPFNTTSSGLLSTSPSQTSKTEQGTASSLSFTSYAQLPSVKTWALTTSILSNSTTASIPAEDTCTDSLASPPFSATSSTTTPTLTSSILTFITLTSAAPSVSSSNTLAGSVTALSATSVSSSSSSSPQPSLCGEQGAFTMNFDDIPPLAVKDNSTADPLPLFSPYHQFYFSDGWTIVPPPTDPYMPSSGQLLVEFLADPDSSLGYTGAVGNGKNTLLGCFTFNAIGMSLGCDSKGPNCDWQFTGLRYNNATNATDTITSQLMSTAACAALANCTLVPIVLDGTFQNLTELRINVTVSGVEKIWWLDDLNLSWFDDSCDAGLCRGGYN